MASQTRSTNNIYRHDNYTTVSSGTGTVKTPTIPADYLLISNTDGSYAALLSFDGGVHTITINANTSLELWPSKLLNYYITDDGTHHVAVQCLYGSEW